MNRSPAVLSVLGRIALGLLLTGCASVPPKGGFYDVEALVSQRLDKDIHWYQGTPEDAEVAARVASLLDGELSLEETVQISLLNNRSLQARYEELGVAQADLVQAGLLRNPVFFAQVRSPNDSALSTNTELNLVQDFLDVLLRPARKRLAGLEFEAAKLRIADAVLNHAAQVKSAYYRLQGSMQVAELLELIHRAAGAASELASRQHAAGNVNTLELAGRQALYEEAKVELVLAEADVLTHREELHRLLSLRGEEIGWKISGKLAPLPAEDEALDQLEALAVAKRLDLAAARLEVESLAAALQVSVRWRWVAVAEVGVNTEKDADGLRLTGPNLQIELPIFDQGQARIARLEALNRQSQQRMMALALDLRSEVREARARLLLHRRLAERFQQVLIPLRERIVEETQRHTNYMLIGAFQLLEAKQDEILAYRRGIEAVRDYWLARTDLELAVGGRLSEDSHEAAEPTPSPAPAPTSAPVPETPIHDSGHDHHR
jgi:cobalt-zinc-cadmium efflux system outer membrane protein